MKPIVVFFLQNPTPLAAAQAHKSDDVKALKEDGYNVLILATESETSVKVFYEKDMVELDKAQLQKLLSFCE